MDLLWILWSCYADPLILYGAIEPNAWIFPQTPCNVPESLNLVLMYGPMRSATVTAHPMTSPTYKQKGKGTNTHTGYYLLGGSYESHTDGQTGKVNRKWDKQEEREGVKQEGRLMTVRELLGLKGEDFNSGRKTTQRVFIRR